MVQEGATPPWTGILEVSVEVSMATGETKKYEGTGKYGETGKSEWDPGTDGRLPPSWIKVVFVLV